MKTVGSILKESRIAKGYSLEQVEKATKIRSKFLEAIESDDYSGLPSPAYAKGFVKNYGDFLGLESSRVLAFFRRQTKEPSRSALLPKQQEELERKFFRLTPGRFLALFVLSLIVIFLLYLGIQYRTFQSAPRLTLDSLKESIVSQRRVDVMGITDPDATVTVNGISVLIRSDGRFFDQVNLDEGENTIIIVSTSRYGKTTTLEKKVTYQP